MTFPEIVNVCTNRHFTFDAKRRDLVVHLVKNEWCYVGSMEYFELRFSHSVANKCGFGRDNCFMPVIFNKSPPPDLVPTSVSLSLYLMYLRSRAASKNERENVLLLFGSVQINLYHWQRECLCGSFSHLT